MTVLNRPWQALAKFGVMVIFLWFIRLTWCAESPRKLEQWVARIGANVYGDVMAIGPEGRIYVAGLSAGGNVPVTANAYQHEPASIFWYQGFLLALDASGSTALYGTYINVTPLRIAVDPAGYVYVLARHVEPDLYHFSPVSWTYSYPAPITPDAVQAYPGQLDETPTLLKFSPNGDLVYGTFLGGAGAFVTGLAVDSRGAATVCGETVDRFLPVSPGAVQSRFLGPSDAFVARVSPDGTQYETLTYLGGAGGDGCADLKIDGEGNVILFGDTNSHAFPVSPDAFQKTLTGAENLFVAKLDNRFERLVWSTYLGGGGEDRAQFLNLGSDGAVILVGWTGSIDFPVTPGTSPPFVVRRDGFRASKQPFLAILSADSARLRSAHVLPFEAMGFTTAALASHSLFAAGGAMAFDVGTNSTLNAVGAQGLGAGDYVSSAGFVLRFDLTTNLATYLGPVPLSGAKAVAGLDDGAAVVLGTGLERYDGVPVRSIGRAPNGGRETTVARLEFPPEKVPSIIQVVNAASLLPGPISPGELFEARGIGLKMPSAARVLVDGQVAPVIPAATDAIVALAPEALTTGAGVSVEAERDGEFSEARTVAVVAANPGLFTADQSGAGQALAENPDGTLNSPATPASRGGVLRLLTTGLGAAPLVSASIGGVEATVNAVRRAAGRPQGYMAIEVTVPRGAPPGDYLPVVVRVSGAASQPGVTVAVR